MIVMVDGQTVFERYYQTTAAESQDIQSVTKSVMSTLVGIALAEESCAAWTRRWPSCFRPMPRS